MTYDFSKYAGKKVMITGGLGFIGSNLAIALVEQGAEVLLVDCRLEHHGANDFNIRSIADQVQIMEADIRDADKMKEAVLGKDVIFNIAGQTSHVDSMVDPFLDNDINTRGHLVFLEACRAVNPEVKVVYCGTRAQYGSPAYTPVDEACPTIGVDIYGADKQVGEQYHFLYKKICDLRATSLRVNNTFGMRHQMQHAKYGVQNFLLRLAMDDQEIKVYGEGNQLRDLNYIEDVVDAFLLAGLSDASDGEAYNLGSEQPVSFKVLVEKLITASGSGSYVHVPYPEERAKIETGDYVADITKAREQLGWQPKFSLEEGLEKTVAFYREFQEHYWRN